MGATGSELPRNLSDNTKGSDSGGNKSGNTGARFGDSAVVTTLTDPELAAVVAAWPDLPPAIRAGVIALVQASGRQP